MKSKRVFAALNALVIAVLACTMGQSPGAGPTTTPDLAATITAQALTLSAPSATAGPPTQTPVPAATGTPTVPIVSVSSATNCRTGPSIYYDLLYTLQPGMTAEVIGKHTPSGYWIVKYPNGQCWLWGQYATVSGNIANLPEYPQPPTPTPAKPVAPSNFKVNFECTLNMAPFIHNEIHVEMSWTDEANNEDGYYVYRDDVLLATLAENSTSHSDDTTMVGLIILGSDPPQISYSIQAFNDAGKSEKRTKSISCFD